MTEPTTARWIADAVPPDGAAAREINFKIPASATMRVIFSFTTLRKAEATVSP